VQQRKGVRETAARATDGGEVGAGLDGGIGRTGQPLVELFALVAAVVLLTLHGSRVFGGLSAQRAWWVLPLALALGVLAADFASGVVHWIGDRFFREDSPIIGPMLIQPFREHHRDPSGITRHGWLELHGNTALPVAIVLGLALGLAPRTLGHPARLIAETTLLCFLVASLATNQLHMWAHMERPPRLARWLQNTRLVLTPDGHARHHANDFQTSYCITTGWLNPLLDALRFFPRLEGWFRHEEPAAP
jgi:hypothetical protein